ncbi:uncharacterized protein [Parasteatoda tepidariorum]|uniref:uncharacterized protein n=1 Tax=Parasteatoda tepidariorum TaxID=114398 RepID=UPI0039BCDE52
MKPVREYRLCTVTYGTPPASYLATRVFKQLVIDEGLDFPKAANLVLHNFYIDEGLFGAESADEAVALISELSELLRKGKFELHKWCTNSPSVLEFLSQPKSIDNASCSTADSKFIKVLGLRWDPKHDDFTYNISFCDDFKDENPTKRSILSCVSKIFDLLGWLSPIIITAKILIQELWKHQLAWDDPVPQDIK